MRQRYSQAVLAVGAMMGLAQGAFAAPVYDNMDGVTNLVGWVWPTNYQPSTATANGDGTVTFTRVAFWDAANSIYPDAGLDWMQGRISLTPDHAQVGLLPVSRDNGFYSVSVLYFDGNGTFSSEQYLTIGSSALGAQSWTLATAAPPPENAASYFLRVRIEPPQYYGDTTPVSVTFDQISAVPEPMGVAVVGLAMPVLLRRRRGA